MKRNLVYTLLLLLFGITMTGCSKSPADDIETLPLALSSQLVFVNQTDPVAKLRILSGNEGYTLVYPKKVRIEGVETDYSESILKLSIDYIDGANWIVIERTLSNGQLIAEEFMVKDHKGQKRLIIVQGADEQYAGGLIDIKEIESRLLRNWNFWQR